MNPLPGFEVQKVPSTACWSYPVNIPVLMSPHIWSFPARPGCYSLLPEGAVTFPILQVFWEQHRWWALSFCNLTPTKESWFPTLFWIKEEDVVFFFHRTHICLSQGKHRLQCLWFPVTKKLSVVCVCVSVSWILMSHVNSTFVTNFTVIDHLHHVWIITSPNRIPNVMTTLMAPSNWFTCVTVAASCCIVLQRLSD